MMILIGVSISVFILVVVYGFWKLVDASAKIYNEFDKLEQAVKIATTVHELDDLMNRLDELVNKSFHKSHYSRSREIIAVIRYKLEVEAKNEVHSHSHSHMDNPIIP